jgi:hypothetical protein
VAIPTKSFVGNIWEICPTTIKCPAILIYHGHNYGANMVNDYRLKYSIFIEVDVLLITGRK